MKEYAKLGERLLLIYKELRNCCYDSLDTIVCNSSSFSLLTESFDVAAFTVYSVLMNVNDLFTLIYSHLFQLDIINDSK